MSRTILYDAENKEVSTAKQSAARVRVRTVALPNEHGGWGLTLEPVVLGLLVAPSAAGFCLAAATLGAFLARHPFKIVAGDRRRGRRFPRTLLAEKFLLLYGSIALLGFSGACLTATGYDFLLPLFVAAPLVLTQLIYDATGRGRSLAPELAGSLGLAGVSTSIALAGSFSLITAGLWAVLAARVVPSILYVRAQLDLLHGERPAKFVSNATHVAGFALVLTLALAGSVPALAAVAVLLLLLRALLGFTEKYGATTAKQVGFREIGFGALLVFLTAAGYAFGL